METAASTLLSLGSSLYESYTDYHRGQTLNRNPYSSSAYVSSRRGEDAYGSLGGGGHGHHGGHGYKEECCPLVIDYLCLALILGSIAAATVFLNQVIQVEIMMVRRRRKREDSFAGIFSNVVREWIPAGAYEGRAYR